MRSKPFRAQKPWVTFQPNLQAILPRGELWTPKTPELELPSSSSMGSDHSRFQIQWFESFWRSGWCRGRLTSRRSCTFHLPSPMPPWTTKILSLIRVANGRYENALPIISKIAGPCSGPIAWMTDLWKPYFKFMCASSWLPRLMKTLSGMAILRAKIIISNSTWCAPRSTKSPLNTTTGQSTVPGKPKQPKSSNTSRSWPWVSPKILQGAFTS
mmetsp:Transcript_164148/g.526361  ORF Transcript_164148/g.526361 Transcript_164148/m.526361 type:complete len:213 (+) Transcript_164148:696-1334(+)